MSSAGEKLERALHGPHKEPVDIYGVDVNGVQHQVLVDGQGKLVVVTP